MTEAVACVPETMQVDGVRQRAQEAYLRRRYDLAAGLYRRLSELEPQEPAHRAKLGDALQRLGCRLMAAESYRMAAQLFHAAGNGAQARLACKAAVALHPADFALRQFFELLRAEAPGDGAVPKPTFLLADSSTPLVTDVRPVTPTSCPAADASAG